MFNFLKKVIATVKRDLKEIAEIIREYKAILVYTPIVLLLISMVGLFLYGGSYQFDMEYNNTLYMVYMLYGFWSDRELKEVFGDYEGELPANSSMLIVTVFGINILVLIISKIHF